MRRKSVVLLLAALLLVVRAPSALETRESRGDNGELLSKYHIDDAGMLHGYYETYHSNAQLQSKGMYSQGRKSGTWVYFGTGSGHS